MIEVVNGDKCNLGRVSLRIGIVSGMEYHQFTEILQESLCLSANHSPLSIPLSPILSIFIHKNRLRAVSWILLGILFPCISLFREMGIFIFEFATQYCY